MKVGIDLDETITAMPEFFSLLTRALLDEGHEVHVITYRDTADEAVKALRERAIAFTRVHVPRAGEIHSTAWKWKGGLARSLALDLMIDDSPEVLASMPPNVKRMWMADPDVFDLAKCIKALKGGS